MHLAQFIHLLLSFSLVSIRKITSGRPSLQNWCLDQIHPGNIIFRVISHLLLQQCASREMLEAGFKRLGSERFPGAPQKQARCRFKLGKVMGNEN